MSNFFDYSKSPAPPSRKPAPKEKPFVNYSKSPKPGAPQQTFVRYDRTPAPGLASETIALPLRPGRARTGANFTESQQEVKLHDLGRYVSEKVSDALRVSDAEGRAELNWHVGALRGAGALDKSAQGQLEKFASRFNTVANPADLLRDQITPFLEGLTATGRGAES